MELKDIKPDVIHLHWLGNEFVSLRDIINFKIPIVWTMHDLWLANPYYHYENKKNKSFFSKILINYLLSKIEIILKKNIQIVPTSLWSNQKLKKHVMLKQNILH